MLKTIRKFHFPVLEIYYKDHPLGFVENEQELIMFRTDIIGCEDGDYYAITPKRTKIEFDRYGGYPFNDEVEHLMPLLSEIVQKQMKLRAEDSKNVKDE